MPSPKTSPSQPLNVPPLTVSGAALPPRKRRRRAPAGGAADDCFTCRRRQIKCDRRRPYCTQCLDQGKDCSGYKTQLTWGVGVASRGKLRGLSLPIVRKPSTPTATTTTATATATTPRRATPRARASCPSIPESMVTSNAVKVEPVDDLGPIRSYMPSTGNGIMTYDFVNMDPTGSPTIPELRSPSYTLQPPAPMDHRYERRSFDSGSSTFPMLRSSLLRWDSRHDPPQVSPMTEDFGLSTSNSSTGCFSDLGDGDIPSPMDYPHTPEDFTDLTTPYSYHNTPLMPQSACMLPMQRLSFSRSAPTSYPDQYPSSASISSSLGSVRSNYEPVEEQSFRRSPCQLASSVNGTFYDDLSSMSSLGQSQEIDLGFG